MIFKSIKSLVIYASFHHKNTKRVAKEIINRAIMAFNVLESKGYTTDEVIALLGDKKLSKWPKTIQRIIE